MNGRAATAELLRAAEEHLALRRSLLPVNSDKRPHGQALISTGHKTSGTDGREKGA